MSNRAIRCICRIAAGSKSGKKKSGKFGTQILPAYFCASFMARMIKNTKQIKKSSPQRVES
jgi:hypothetical protein